MAHFQPVIRIADMAVSTLEVPGRVARGGASSLTELMSDITEEELLGALTDEVVHITLRDITEHAVTVPIAVNIPPQVVTGRLHGRLKSALDVWGLPSDRLAVEVTEDALTTNADARTALDDLRADGHPVVLDDVGAGRRTMSALGDLPVDAIKLDERLVAAMTTDEIARGVVADLIETAHVLHMEVIAQGVDDANTYERLVELGIDAMQGAYICPPRPLDASYANWPLLHRLAQ